MDYRKALPTGGAFYVSFFSTKIIESKTAKILVASNIELRTNAYIGINARISEKTSNKHPVNIQ